MGLLIPDPIMKSRAVVIRQDIMKDFSGYSMIVEQPDGTVVEYVEQPHSY